MKIITHILTIFLMSALSAHSETHALLIGVSEYPYLSRSLWLKGPKQDVINMQKVLINAGINQQKINILSDALGTPATKQKILSSLDEMIVSANDNDWLILYFSGHGTRVPVKNIKSDNELDHMDEVFLPYNTKKWNPKLNQVENGIIDNELAVKLAKAKQKGINVWAIFDTCHSGDMAKSFPNVTNQQKYRYISPALLGAPENVQLSATKFIVPTSNAVKNNTGVGKQVFYYASHEDEVTPEELLPNGVDQKYKAVQGLFSWSIQNSLANFKGSFADLSAKIKQQYTKENRPFPTPLFVGDLSQQIVF